MTVPWTEGCRCGVNKDKESCTNILGLRKTKCRCFKIKSGCNAACGCKNCANPYGSRSDQATHQIPSDRESRKERKKSYKQGRTTTYLMETGADPPKGRWSDLETLTLIVMSNLLQKTSLPVDTYHLHSFYHLFRNFLCNKELLQDVPISVKELRQISAKQQHISIQYL